MKKTNQHKDPMLHYLEYFSKAMPGNFYWKDIEGHYLGCNELLLKTLGLATKKDIVGKSDLDLWPSQAETLKENDQYVINSRKILYKEESVTLNNEVRYYMAVKMPLLNEKDQVVGIIGNSLDITELKETQRLLREEKEKAEAANKAKTEFLENMRHDIRTPLIGIVGSADLIKNQASNSQVQRYAEDISLSSHALLGLLNEVLEATKVASGEIPLLRKKFNLQQKIDQVIKLNQAKAAAKDLTLSLDYDKSIPTYFIGDPTRIHRIVLELVTNALNFTDVGNVKITTQLAKRVEQRSIIKIMISDTGIGIPKDKQEEIFTRFKRLTPSYEGIYKGTGLGLTIVKQFIDELHGEIYVDSTPGMGSTFTCVLPFDIALLDEPDGMTEEEPQKLAAHHTNKIMPSKPSIPMFALGTSSEQNHILVVEDQEIAAMIIRTHVMDLGYKAVIAKDGKTAYELAKNHSYQLIFMDIGLPDTTGYEVTKLIRLHEQKTNQHVPIIGLTAHVDKDNKHAEAGMDTILSKPLSKIQMKEIIDHYTIPQTSKDLPQFNIIHKPHPANDDHIANLELVTQILGSEEKIQEVLAIMKESLSADLAQFNEAYSKNNISALKNILLRIKSNCCYFNAYNIDDVCAQLLDQLATPKKRQDGKLRKKLANEIDVLLKFINENSKK